MVFLVKYSLAPAAVRTAQERFVSTGGAPPPPGVRKVASYHYADGSGGYTVADTDDPVALARWCNQWTDVLELDLRPVLSDEQLGQMLAS